MLTRIPIGRLAGRAVPSASCAWAFPVIGCVTGGLAAGVFTLAIGVGLPAPLAAILTLMALLLLTGALHEDGLADMADGLGGSSPEQSLAIMRDSRIGSYGAAALILSLGYRGEAIAELGPRAAATGLIVSAAVSRTAMLGIPWLLAPARRDGLGAGFGRPRLGVSLAAFAISLLIGWALLPGAKIVAVCLAAGAMVLPVVWSAGRRLGGYTGDAFGAAQQLAECAALSVLVAWPVPL